MSTDHGNNDKFVTIFLDRQSESLNGINSQDKISICHTFTINKISTCHPFTINFIYGIIENFHIQKLADASFGNFNIKVFLCFGMNLLNKFIPKRRNAFTLD